MHSDLYVATLGYAIIKDKIGLIYPTKIRQSYQEGAEHEETDKVDDGKVAATGELFTRFIV